MLKKYFLLIKKKYNNLKIYIYERKEETYNINLQEKTHDFFFLVNKYAVK